MNHLYVMVDEATNGVGHAVVAAPPSDNPYRWLIEWFERQGFKKPVKAARAYKIVDRIEDATPFVGVVSSVQWFDGVISYGRGRPTRYDF